MALAISLTDIKPIRWTVDTAERTVRVDYRLADADGLTWGDPRQAVFWAEIPVWPDPTPDNWYLLPGSYVATLASLTVDALAAIAARELA